MSNSPTYAEYGQAMRRGTAALAEYFRSHTVDTKHFLNFMQRRRIGVNRFYEYVDIVLCGGFDKKTFLSDLRQRLGNTGTCSQSFSKHEVVYICRTCQLDDTCAVCISCFHGGDHEGHDFAMRSVVGGCCDCGDPQAWSGRGNCTRHGNRGLLTNGDPLDSLDVEFRERLQLAVSFGVNYTVAALGGLDNSALSNRRLVKIATAGLDWIRSVCQYGPPFVRAFSTALTQPSPVARLSSLSPLGFLLGLLVPPVQDEEDEERVLRRPSSLQDSLGRLCVMLLSDPVFRAPFLSHLLPLYSRLRRLHSQLLDRLSVQVFTVGALASDFVNKVVVRRLLKLLAETLKRASTNTATRRGHTRLTVDCVNGLIRNDRASPYYEICIDLRYMLRHKQVSADAASVAANVAPLVRVLALLQRMHPFSRRLGTHVEFEHDTWMIAFELENEVAEVFTLVADRLRAAESYTHFLLTELVAAIITDISDQDSRRRAQLDVSLSPVSLHIPLHRSLAVVCACAARASCLEASLRAAGVERAGDFFLRYAESVVNVEVVLAQMRAGMWVRNGQMSEDIDVVFRGPAASSRCLLPDLFGLQLVCLYAPPDEVLELSVRRFGLAAWLSPTLQDMRASRQTECVLAEELLRLIVALVVDRTMCDASAPFNIRRELINVLAAANNGISHSELVDRIPNTVTHHPDFERMLSEVSSFRNQKGRRQGLYELKRDCWAEFDPFWMRFIQADLSSSLSRFESECQERELCVSLPSFNSVDGVDFNVIGGVLESSVLHRLLCTALLHAVTASHRVLWSDRISRAVLHLLTLCTSRFLTMTAGGGGKRQRTSRFSSSSSSNQPGPSFLGVRLEGGQGVVDLLVRCNAAGVFCTAESKHSLRRLVQMLHPFAPALRAILEFEHDEHVRVRKAKARARQQRLLQSFSARRHTFVRTNADASAVASAAGDSAAAAVVAAAADAAGLGGELGELARQSSCALCSECGSEQHPLGLVSFLSATRVAAIARTSGSAATDSAASSSSSSSASSLRRASVALSTTDTSTGAGTGTGTGWSAPRAPSRGTAMLNLEQMQAILRSSGVQISAGIETTMPGFTEGLRGRGDNELASFFMMMMRRYQAEPRLQRPLVLDFDWCESAGLHLRSCGHHLHQHCLHDYLVAQGLVSSGSTASPRHPVHFSCPVCRRLSSMIVPIPNPGVFLSTEAAVVAQQDALSLEEWLSLHVGKSSSALEASLQPPPRVSKAVQRELEALVARVRVSFPSSDSDVLLGERLRSPMVAGPSGSLCNAVILLSMAGSVVELLDVRQHERLPPAPPSLAQRAVAAVPSAQRHLLLLLMFWVSQTQRRQEDQWHNAAWTQVFAPSAADESQQQKQKPSLLMDTNLFGVLLQLYPLQRPASARHLLDVLQMAQLMQAMLIDNPIAPSEKQGPQELQDAARRLRFACVHDLRTLAAFVRAARRGAISFAGQRVQETDEDEEEDEEQEMAVELVLGEHELDAMLQRVTVFCAPFVRKVAVLQSVTPHLAAHQRHLFVDDATLVPPIVERLLRCPLLRSLVHQWIGGATQHLYVSEPLVAPRRRLRATTARVRAQAAAASASVRRDSERVSIPDPRVLLAPGRPFQLVSLPRRFHELFFRYSKRNCSVCAQSSPSGLALCLLCGQTVCFTENMPCDADHLKTCDGRSGIFFVLDKCSVMLVHENQSAPWTPSLYVDDHGEDDVYLERGHALHLDTNRLQELTDLYVSNSIPDFVSRRTQEDVDMRF